MSTDRHLLGLEHLPTEDLHTILSLSASFTEVNARAIPKVPALRGRTVATVFFEDSTRTRLSFEAAAKRLSADTMSFSVSTSSVNKGESIRDTVQTVTAMGLDAMVVRHSSAGVPHQITKWVDCSVINAGDGWHEHPTQGLLDAYTLHRHFGSLEGLRIALVGDIKHSRVARSDVWAYTKLGAEVVLVAPRTLLPPDIDGWPVTVTADLDSVIGDVDVLALLRMQHERMNEAIVPHLREYTERFGFTAARYDALKPGAVFTHPGPMNRGVEIAPELADAPGSLILDQVANGVSVRMAVLFLLLGSEGAPVPVPEPSSDAAGVEA